MRIDLHVGPWALLCALALLVVSLPLAGTAEANHGARTLDLTPEKRNHPVNGTKVITAKLNAAPDADGPITIRFEVAGPGDPEPTPGDTPATPDLTCEVAPGTTQCTVSYSSDTLGQDVIRGWIDHDGDPTTVEADLTEGRDEEAEPGTMDERDGTDVILTRWFEDLPGKANLTCTPGAERELPDPVTVNCTLKSADARFEGWTLDAENLDGANDPDDSAAFDTTTNPGANYDDICTTGADGSCVAQIEPVDGELGAARVCFWVDEDHDGSFHRTPKRDGAMCDDPEPGAGQLQGTHNTTAFATVEWVGSQAVRSVTLNASQSIVASGRPLTLSGSVDSDEADCAEGVVVEIQRKRGHTGVFKQWATVITGDVGSYTRDLEPKVSATYRAVLDETAGCFSHESEGARVDVRKVLTLESSRKRVEPGRVVKLRARVLSCTKDVTDKVVLSKLVNGKFRKQATARTNDNCAASFRRRIKRRSIFRVHSPRDADQMFGASRRVTVRLK